MLRFGRVLARSECMDLNDPLISTAMLATASGARVMTGVSATTYVLARVNRVSNQVAKATKAMAAGELIGDKLPNIPDRNDGMSLVGRVAAGAAIGAVIGDMTNRDRAMLAIAGGLAAFLSAQATYRMRRGLSRHMPAVAAALVEDAAIVSIATVGAVLFDDVLETCANGASLPNDASRP